MEFRDLKKQYEAVRVEIDHAIKAVLESTSFIMGEEVKKLEKELADYVGAKECITCGNGTDALQLALMVWGVGKGDAIFLPDFTFFSTGEVVAALGAIPIFVNVERDTYNISIEDLQNKIDRILKEDQLTPKAVISVDLFGLPANYDKIRPLAEKYGLKLLEDGAQGFGGSVQGKKACSFGDISTTSFFPAKPLGCYGDGGAIFTDNEEWAELLRSYRVHGKGNNKYDNVRVGMNSRLDTIQAAVLRVKLKQFRDVELDMVQEVAEYYNTKLQGKVQLPFIPKGYLSSYAQYTIQARNREERDSIQVILQAKGIPSMIYYTKPMHSQKAFDEKALIDIESLYTQEICDRVLSLPMHPYMAKEDIDRVCEALYFALGEC